MLNANALLKSVLLQQQHHPSRILPSDLCSQVLQHTFPYYQFGLLYFLLISLFYCFSQQHQRELPSRIGHTAWYCFMYLQTFFADGAQPWTPQNFHLVKVPDIIYGITSLILCEDTALSCVSVMMLRLVQDLIDEMVMCLISVVYNSNMD